MMRRFSVVALFAATALVACSTDVNVAAPTKSVSNPNFSVAASLAGQYLVLFDGKNVASLTARVTALGGTVTSAHAGAGFAVVSGLTSAAAADLSATNGVSD